MIITRSSVKRPIRNEVSIARNEDSREPSARHRAQILEVATKLFLERGLEGVGVAELMASDGFTHGGFYGHFASKEKLIDECCARAFAEKMEMWQAELASDQGRP